LIPSPGPLFLFPKVLPPSTVYPIHTSNTVEFNGPISFSPPPHHLFFSPRPTRRNVTKQKRPGDDECFFSLLSPFSPRAFLSPRRAFRNRRHDFSNGRILSPPLPFFLFFHFFPLLGQDCHDTLQISARRVGPFLPSLLLFWDFSLLLCPTLVR